jgi:cyclopropane fatty-acyl-phospholipid synthase-like methyltransferase
METMNDLPFAPASERNKRPILERLHHLLPQQGRLLEIGAGTGQHAVFFAPVFPGLVWQTSERPEELDGLRRRIEQEGPAGMPPPLPLDVLRGPWPDGPFDAVYSSNTAHIMSWQAVCAMFTGVGRLLAPSGCFCLYGPFNVDGCYTAPSNREFDIGLRTRDPSMGLRDIAEIEALALESGLVLAQRLDTPTNNFLLVFRRRKSGRDDLGTG